jgi:hypothetical protein
MKSTPKEKKTNPKQPLMQPSSAQARFTVRLPSASGWNSYPFRRDFGTGEE